MDKPNITPLKFENGIADDGALLYYVKEAYGGYIAFVEFQDTGETISKDFDFEQNADAYNWLQGMSGYYAGFDEGYKIGYQNAKETR